MAKKQGGKRCQMKQCPNTLCISNAKEVKSHCDLSTESNGIDACPLKKAFEAFDKKVKNIWNNPKIMYDYWQKIKEERCE
jgi:hypothetical protein